MPTAVEHHSHANTDKHGKRHCPTAALEGLVDVTWIADTHFAGSMRCESSENRKRSWKDHQSRIDEQLEVLFLIPDSDNDDSKIADNPNFVGVCRLFGRHGRNTVCVASVNIVHRRP